MTKKQMIEYLKISLSLLFFLSKYSLSLLLLLLDYIILIIIDELLISPLINSRILNDLEFFNFK